LKISIQKGMAALEQALILKGHDVVPYRQSGSGAKVNIINNIDAEYEEMEPVSYIGAGENEVMILNASQMSVDQVLTHVEKFSRPS
jgi:hypothetical protein